MLITYILRCLSKTRQCPPLMEDQTLQSYEILFLDADPLVETQMPLVCHGVLNEPSGITINPRN